MTLVFEIPGAEPGGGHFLAWQRCGSGTGIAQFTNGFTARPLLGKLCFFGLGARRIDGRS